MYLHYGLKLPVVSSVIVEKEMGYSRHEFLNQFKLLALQFDYKIRHNTITIVNTPDTIVNTMDTMEKQFIEITLLEKQARQLGSLIIPCLAVSFSFKNYTRQQRLHFLQGFDLSFQRGGG